MNCLIFYERIIAFKGHRLAKALGFCSQVTLLCIDFVSSVSFVSSLQTHLEAPPSRMELTKRASP